MTTRQAILLAFILLVLAAVFAVLTVEVFGRDEAALALPAF